MKHDPWIESIFEDATDADVFCFREINSPETDSIDVPLGRDFQCPCGHVMNLGGAWLAAHWNDELIRKCENCGQMFDIESGEITLVGNPYGRPRRKDDDDA